MDFFVLMFEEWLTKVTKPFDSIDNVAMRTTLQIITMILCTAISVGVVFGINLLFSFVCDQIPFANNRIVRVAMIVVAFVLWLVLVYLFVRFVSWIISIFVS